MYPLLENDEATDQLFRLPERDEAKAWVSTLGFRLMVNANTTRRGSYRSSSGRINCNPCRGVLVYRVILFQYEKPTKYEF